MEFATNPLNNVVENFSLDIQTKLSQLFSKDSPYMIKNGVRYIRNTNKLVADSNHIVMRDNNQKETIYSSISECSKINRINRKVLKDCIVRGVSHKGYTFSFI